MQGKGKLPLPLPHRYVEICLLGQRQHPAASGIETGDGKLRKVDRKPAIIDRQQADSFSPQHLTEKHLVLLPTELALMMHTAHQHGGRVLRFWYPRRIRARRRRITRGRGLHAQGLVRTHLVVLLAKAIEGALLRPPVVGGRLAVSCFSVRCMRSCRPFCSGCPAAIRSGTIPSFIHHTASRDSPAIAREANGAPLSVRIAAGIPYSRNAASKIARTRAVSVFSTAWQRSR